MPIVTPLSRRWPILLLALVLLTFQAAAAQGSEPTVGTASLRLWPEYDDPGLLVISSGTLDQSTALPLQAEFPIPDGARGIQATVDDPASGLMNRTWEVRDGKLAYELDLPDYHYEFYVDRPPSGNQREIRYTFEAPYRMNSLEVAIQEPARATDFSVEPAPAGSFVGPDGLTYHTLTKEDLAPGERFDITIRYNKTDNALSSAVAAQPVPTQAATKPTTSRATTVADRTPDWLAYALIGAGVLGVVAILGYFLLQQRRAPAFPARARQPRPTVPAEPKRSQVGASSDPGVFCTQCGRRFGADERFCAQCGTPRRA